MNRTAAPAAASRRASRWADAVRHHGVRGPVADHHPQPAELRPGFAPPAARSGPPRPLPRPRTRSPTRYATSAPSADAEEVHAAGVDGVRPPRVGDRRRGGRPSAAASVPAHPNAVRPSPRGPMFGGPAGGDADVVPSAERGREPGRLLLAPAVGRAAVPPAGTRTSAGSRWAGTTRAGASGRSGQVGRVKPFQGAVRAARSGLVSGMSNP